MPFQEAAVPGRLCHLRVPHMVEAAVGQGFDTIFGVLLVIFW